MPKHTGRSGERGSYSRISFLAEGVATVALDNPGTGESPVAGAYVRFVARTGADDWLAHLTGVDAVVNAAGVLQDSPWDSTHGVHAAGPAALFEACERAGVRRVVHISAVGVERDGAIATEAGKYVYLLGLYLGDGWIGDRPRGVFDLQIYCCDSYPGLIAECFDALAAMRSRGSARWAFVRFRA